MGLNVNWGSVADWLTVLVAAPAATLFLLDRRQANKSRLSVTSTSFIDFNKMTIRFRPETLDRGFAVRIEAIQPPDVAFGDITHSEPAQHAASDLWVRMTPDNNRPGEVHCRVSVRSPSQLPSAVMVKISLVRVPGKKPFISRKMRISALS